jgi:hypothetical protein
MLNGYGEFHKKYKEIIKESTAWHFLIQDGFLLIFNREDYDSDMIGIPQLKRMADISKDNSKYIIDTLKKQYFDVEVVNNDEYEDGVYFQINGKEVTVGVMVSLEKLNDGDINTLRNYLIKDGLVQGV